MAEPLLAGVFVELADTLVDDFDLIEFLNVLTGRCTQLLDVEAAGLLLTDARGRLRVVAASSERTRLLGLFQLQTDEGPCLDCFRTGAPVSVPDLRNAGRWPAFTAAATGAGFAAVHALPMRLRSDVIGALNLLTVARGALDPHQLGMGQALADIATIGLLQQRAIHRRDVLNEQLQVALDSRVLIEQATGLLAERLHVNVADAFDILRDGARRRNQRLSDVARDLVHGTGQPVAPVAHAAPGDSSSAPHPGPPMPAGS